MARSTCSTRPPIGSWSASPPPHSSVRAVTATSRRSASPSARHGLSESPLLRRNAAGRISASAGYSSNDSSDSNRASLVSRGSSAQQTSLWNSSNSWLSDTINPAIALGERNRFHMTQDGTSGRALYRNGSLGASGGAAQRPGGAGDTLFFGAEDADLREYGPGDYDGRQLRHGVLVPRGSAQTTFLGDAGSSPRSARQWRRPAGALPPLSPLAITGAVAAPPPASGSLRNPPAALGTLTGTFSAAIPGALDATLATAVDLAGESFAARSTTGHSRPRCRTWRSLVGTRPATAPQRTLLGIGLTLGSSAVTEVIAPVEEGDASVPLHVITPTVPAPTLTQGRPL